jgi:hypothetical protein
VGEIAKAQGPNNSRSECGCRMWLPRDNPTWDTTATMTPRRASQAISGERGQDYELDSTTRGKIEGARWAGPTFSAISQQFKCSPSAAHKTIALAPHRSQGNSIQRPGRPPKTTDRDKRRIIRYARIDPKHTCKQMQDALQLLLSYDSLTRIPDTVNIRN